MSEARFVTGATGFLGSHLVAQFLAQYDEGIVVCFARSKAGRSARSRVEQAVLEAFRDQGLKVNPLDWQKRLAVAEDDLTGREALVKSDFLAMVEGYEIGEFWHCAASVEFTGVQGGAVWRTNVEGVQTLSNSRV